MHYFHVTATFCRKTHWNLPIGSKYMSIWRMPKTIGNKRHFLPCLAVSQNQYFWFPTDFAWSHHKCETDAFEVIKITFKVKCNTFSLHTIFHIPFQFPMYLCNSISPKQFPPKYKTEFKIFDEENKITDSGLLNTANFSNHWDGRKGKKLWYDFCDELALCISRFRYTLFAKGIFHHIPAWNSALNLMYHQLNFPKIYVFGKNILVTHQTLNMPLNTGTCLGVVKNHHKICDSYILI